MAKRILIVALLVLAGAVAGWLLARAPVPSRTTGDFKVEAAGSAWPADRAWTLSFDPPRTLGARSGIALRFRAKSTTLAPDESPAIGGESEPMSAAEAEREFAAGTLASPGRDLKPEPWSGRAAVQLLDLSQTGVASAKPGRDLRLLANIGVGGVRTDLTGDNTILPAGRIAGHSFAGEGRWKNNQLYLMSFYVEGDGKLWRYDVFVDYNPAFNAAH